MAYQYWFYNPVTTQYVARVHEMTTKQLEFERDALNCTISNRCIKKNACLSIGTSLSISIPSTMPVLGARGNEKHSPLHPPVHGASVVEQQSPLHSPVRGAGVVERRSPLAVCFDCVVDACMYYLVDVCIDCVVGSA